MCKKKCTAGILNTNIHLKKYILYAIAVNSSQNGHVASHSTKGSFCYLIAKVLSCSAKDKAIAPLPLRSQVAAK